MELRLNRSILDIGRRIWLFASLVGSHNYNLSTEESDKDYKVFILPTFDDLYKGKLFSTAVIGEKYDVDVHDTRKIIDLFAKSNINFLEVLFSEEFCVNDMVSDYTVGLLNQILEMKDSIARMNLPYLYKACIGMHQNKMKLLEKGTSGTQHLVEKYGWDTKQGMHAYRVLDFLERFMETGFEDFKQAIKYDDPSSLLSIKHGEYSLEEFREMAKKKLATIERLWPEYNKYSFDASTKKKLEEIVKEIVRTNLVWQMWEEL